MSAFNGRRSWQLTWSRVVALPRHAASRHAPPRHASSCHSVRPASGPSGIIDAMYLITRRVLWAAVWLFPLAGWAAELPIFDAHLHYSHDTRDVLPAKTAAEILRKAGVKRALVSSTNDAGT